MIEKLFKSLSIKIIAGAFVVVIVVLGFLLLGEKRPQNRIPEVKKIPKPHSTVQPSLEKISTKSMPSEAVPETTTNREISESDESLLNPENPLESEKGDKTDSIAVEEILEEEETADSISTVETSVETKTKSIDENEINAFSKKADSGETGKEEPLEEKASVLSEKPEVEAPLATEQPEPETRVVEKKQLVPEQDEKNSIQDIVLSESDSEHKLVVRTSGSVVHFNHFFLGNPPRFVMDLSGDWKNPDFIARKPDGNSLISRIRLWNHGDKLRIVTDLKSDKTLVPIVTKSSDGIEVVLKDR